MQREHLLWLVEEQQAALMWHVLRNMLHVAAWAFPVYVWLGWILFLPLMQNVANYLYPSCSYVSHLQIGYMIVKVTGLYLL